MSVGAAGPLSETGRIVELVLKHAHEAFGDQARVDREWHALGFTGPPDFDRAVDEYAQFVDLLQPRGLRLRCLPDAPGTGLDSIYVRDASVVSPAGVILCAMGKAARAAEPDAQARALREWGVAIAGAIEPPGCLEGGDVVWLDDRTVVVGRGYRTNDDGIRQFRALLGDDVDCLTVHLPHWRGRGDVFHLMSVVSPVDADLAVVYSPLIPVPLRECLLDRGVTLVEVPDSEFATLGANVLAVAPRQCVMVDGNPVTRARLEAAGAEVRVYAGREISLKGGGGPTCLTRPIRRT
jgi:N-dimethylarginine dimethylaminohydrolase